MEILPSFPTFDLHADGVLAQRWEKWIEKLEILFVAMNVTDKKRQRALLLHYAGDCVYNVFTTINDTGDTFTTTKGKFKKYFEPRKIIAYAIYTFRQLKQSRDEKMDAFVTRLRQAAQHCNFADADAEVKNQIIQNCASQRLRRKALKDTTLTLTKLIEEARAI
ncbi:uncharacterized protein LOC117103993 [Anneissia japonica]|uniref:uncharacterized protein LOC117103993 n=1 Tax=Anneissia japonica TaxID=1529436 RepID=UPI00142572BD|nr:uncharacterized protein LOC117103993 [Anneissia japonica]